MKPKILALYLPQFHRMKENDEWWGDGFTEWTNVRNAEPLYKGHNQPRVPLNNNYYDLTNPDSLRWQAKIAHDYDIDGFIFYHYWFGKKMLMEKPAELLLKEKNIDMKFCFSWANQSWARGWIGAANDLLIKQEYISDEEIINHFNYVLQFFNDERYIKIDNKPIFFIYIAKDIPQYEKFISIWNEKAIENGFAGIYFVETLNSYCESKISENTECSFYMEPQYITARPSLIENIIYHIKSFHPITRNFRLSYDTVWKKILKKEHLSESSWAGAFVDWDNSPRKKRQNFIITKQNAKKFHRYFSMQYKKCAKSKSPFIIINAWNEWGEGTYLEPDERNKWNYLQSIKQIVEQGILEE